MIRDIGSKLCLACARKKLAGFPGWDCHLCAALNTRTTVASASRSLLDHYKKTTEKEPLAPQIEALLADQEARKERSRAYQAAYQARKRAMDKVAALQNASKSTADGPRTHRTAVLAQVAGVGAK